MFAEALPLEHVLLAWLACRVAVLRFIPAFALLGFAVHTGGYHRALAEREGGHPMFEPSVLELQELGRVSCSWIPITDSTWATSRARPMRPARSWWLAGTRTRRTSHCGARSVGPSLTATCAPSTARRDSSHSSRPESNILEAEADWPPLLVTGGWVDSAHPSASCLRGSGALVIHPEDSSRGRSRDPTPRHRTAHRLGRPMRGAGRWAGHAATESSDWCRWNSTENPQPGDCWEVVGPPLPADEGARRLILSTGPSPVGFGPRWS